MICLTGYVLLLVLWKESQADCETRPWTAGIADKDLLSFHCKAQQYLVCEDVNDLDRIRDLPEWLNTSCGVQVKCTNLPNKHYFLYVEDFTSSTEHAMLLIEVDGCGLERGNIHFELYSSLQVEIHLSFLNNSLTRLQNIEVENWGWGDAFVSSLNLSSNLLTNVSTLTHHWFTYVKALDIHSNQIDNIDDNAFVNALNLRWVDLGNNNISRVPQLGIQRDAAVTVLLNNNRISAIDTNAFNRSNIELLDLSGNFLSTIDAETFNSVSRIETLRLGKNSITSVEPMAFELTQIVTLDLSGNLLDGIRANALSRLPELQTLILSNNKLAFIDRGAFKEDTQLSYVDLSHNALETIPNGVFSELPSLKTLLLCHNVIKAFESAPFTGLHIVNLSLKNNPLENLEGATFTDVSVKDLDISQCQLTDFPYSAVSALGSDLKLVNLSANWIRDFSNDGLDLRFHMESLDLSSNRFDTISCFWLADSLDYLYLHNNNISTIDNCLFPELMFTRSSFTLGGNPLDCCSLKWLQDIAMALGNLLDAQETFCAQPSRRPFLDQSGDFDDCHLLTTAATINREPDSGSGGDFDQVVVIGSVVGTFVGTLVLLGGAAVIYWLVKKRRANDEPKKFPSLPNSETKHQRSKPAAAAATPRHYKSSSHAVSGTDASATRAYTGLVKSGGEEYEMDITDQPQPIYETVDDNL